MSIDNANIHIFKFCKISINFLNFIDLWNYFLVYIKPIKTKSKQNKVRKDKTRKMNKLKVYYFILTGKKQRKLDLYKYATIL